jgi:hypothetical protein
MARCNVREGKGDSYAYKVVLLPNEEHDMQDSVYILFVSDSGVGLTRLAFWVLGFGAEGEF